MPTKSQIPNLEPAGKTAAWVRLFEMVERIMDRPRPRRKPAVCTPVNPVEFRAVENRELSKPA